MMLSMALELTGKFSFCNINAKKMDLKCSNLTQIEKIMIKPQRLATSLI